MDDYYDEDEFEGWDDDEDFYDDTDDRLTNIELALAGEGKLVPVPVEYAEQMLADEEEAAAWEDYYHQLDESIGAIETQLGRELTGAEMDALAEGAFRTGWDPVDFAGEIVSTDLSDDEDRVQTMAEFMDDEAAYQEADAEGYEATPVEQ
jgi:hypothetical protein